MDLFPISESQIEKIHKFYGTNNERVVEDRKILEEWIRQHPHLPKEYQYDRVIERMLAVSKYNVEQAKRRIENFFVLKKRSCDFYDVFVTSEFVQPCKNNVMVIPLPKLGPDNERIIMFGVKCYDPDNYTFQHFLQATIAAIELALRYDKCNSLRIIADGTGYTFDYIKKLEWSKCYRCIDLLINGYGAKLAAFDIINALPAAEFLFNAVKKVIKAKLVQRVKFHGTTKALYQSIAPEYLPEEYGGSAGKLSDLIEKLNIAIEKHREVFADSTKYEIDEKNFKACGARNNDELFGVDGTFKKLNLD